jgi:Phosphotransferase enzyme family
VSGDGVEEQLSQGGVTHVVRVGDTVRRPVRPFTSSVQAYLSYVRSRGADFVPEPLGYDDVGREVLGFIAGEVPERPLPDWALADEVIVGLARLIRRLHDAADGFDPPKDATWGSLPGIPSTQPRRLFATPELVSHQDYCPGNVVFVARQPVALIDFDLARPTTRALDCVNALHWWAPLMHPLDRPASLSDADVFRRVAVFADAYGMTPEQRGQIVPLAQGAARNSQITMRAAAEADPVFKRWWDEGAKDRLPRHVQWLTAQSEAISASIQGA